MTDVYTQELIHMYTMDPKLMRSTIGKCVWINSCM